MEEEDIGPYGCQLIWSTPGIPLRAFTVAEDGLQDPWVRAGQKNEDKADKRVISVNLYKL